MTEPQRFDHPLEELLKAPASDILDAVYSGFRAQVDVKGKLAELYFAKRLEALKQDGSISDYVWSDEDDEPDFIVDYQGHRLRVECKNVRSGDDGIYKRGERAGCYKVEIQKTRGGTDPETGEQTRGYRFDRFELLAACLFNQTGQWDFLYTPAFNLIRRANDQDLLAVFQPVPPKPRDGWTVDLQTALEQCLA